MASCGDEDADINSGVSFPKLIKQEGKGDVAGNGSCVVARDDGGSFFTDGQFVQPLRTNRMVKCVGYTSALFLHGRRVGSGFAGRQDCAKLLRRNLSLLIGVVIGNSDVSHTQFGCRFTEQRRRNEVGWKTWGQVTLLFTTGSREKHRKYWVHQNAIAFGIPVE